MSTAGTFLRAPLRLIDEDPSNIEGRLRPGRPSSSYAAPSAKLEREISRAVVAIYKEYLGRGAAAVKTTLGADVAICVLKGSLSKAERVMTSNDRGSTVRGMRREYQVAMRQEIVASVEALTGREAVAFLSDHDAEADVAVEVIRLSPLEELAG